MFSLVAAWVLVGAWVLLGLSVAAGVVAYLRIPIKIAEAKLELNEDRWFWWPGFIHCMAFFFGILALGVALAIALIAKAGAPTDADTDKNKQTQGAAVRVLGPPLLVGRVGPFASGKVADLEPAPAGERWLRIEDLAVALRAPTSDAALGYLILVGSADKIELLPALRRQYGSNASLARLRAETVRRAVEAALGREVSTVALATGPEVQGEGLTSAAARVDRSVAVYAAWWNPATVTR